MGTFSRDPTTDIVERVSVLSSVSRTKDEMGDDYFGSKTPPPATAAFDAKLEEGKGAALREGGAPKLWSRECFGLFAQYAAVGMIYGTLPGTIYPFLQNYLNIEGTQTVSARTLVTIPWSFKVFYGILSDCFPLFGFRRRPYMVLGWIICFVMLLVMSSIPTGEPYYTDPSVRNVKPDDYTQQQKDSLNPEASTKGGIYVVLMMLSSFGYLMANVAADAVVVEYAQREPEEIRGRTQTAIYTVRTVFMIVSNVLTAFTFNGIDYGGEFEWTLEFPELMMVLAVFCAPIIPVTWYFVTENKVTEAPKFTTYIKEFWEVLQTRAVYQIIAYKFFSGIFENFTFVASDPMQTYWARVTPLNDKLCNIFALVVMAVTLAITGKYGLHWNWRSMTVITLLAAIVLDAICMLLTTWNIVRSQWFWLGLPIIEQFPQSVGFIVSTYVVVELASSGNEGAIYGLITTVSNLSDPFAKTLSKNINIPFNTTNKRIQNDSTSIRMDITYTILIMYAMKLLSLAFLPLLPPQKKETQVLKATGGKSKLMGIFTLVYVVFAMIWSVMTNLMSMFPSTSCLKIAGGPGCKD